MVGGCSVVRWAIVEASSQASPSPAATRLVICSDDTIGAFYLFRCDDLWQVAADTWHETVEEAMRQAQFEYPGILGGWQSL
jgi:hypothetical protein